ncbi:hypothetical protein B0H94_1043 [Salsuginibacillus halophilus]|uniref:Tetratricopeptide repeat protein n=1 Tax=Salsuginibacillus halophilus TaxID=517424 RepID=A0A2P8HQ93_9BACI|nr:tetratricopeptide repeat protein [Salsuginibacillus halophilus]PSL48403.1 hypothetical protein B0H94_1043 [Salsuginibacillus halophilus]
MKRMEWLKALWQALDGSAEAPLPRVRAEGDPLEQLSEAYGAYQRGAYDDAVRRLKAYLDEHPNDPHGHMCLGVVLEAREKPVSALYYIVMAYQYVGNADIAGRAMERVKKKLSRKEAFNPREFSFSLTGGSENVTFTYDIRDLSERRRMYEYAGGLRAAFQLRRVIDLNPREGIPLKVMHDYGVPVTAFNNNFEDRGRYVYFIYFHLVRNAASQLPRMYQPAADVWEHHAGDASSLAFYDVRLDDDDEEIITRLRRVTRLKAQPVFVSFRTEEKDDTSLIKQAVAGTGYTAKRLTNSGVQMYWLIPPGRDMPVHELQRVRLPVGPEVEENGASVFQVPLSLCVDQTVTPYASKMEHHFTRTLLEYVKSGETKAPEDLYMTEVYGRFQPQNRYEQLFHAPAPRAVPPLTDGWPPLPWLGDPSITKAQLSPEPGETRPGGNHHHGPNTPAFIAAEVKRLAKALRLIEQAGYEPEAFPDGYVEGYLLVNDDDSYRFVVAEGQHRMAALAVKNYKEVRVKFSPSDYRPNIIRRQDVKKWPLVQSGMYSRKAALKVFDRFFE